MKQSIFDKEKIVSTVYEMIGTVLGAGYLPLAPGTWGSIIGLFFVWLLQNHICFYICFFLLSFFVGVKASGFIEEATGEKDPSKVVIDEFACIFIAFLFIPLSIFNLSIGFCVYRVLDIIKPPPAARLESIKGGWGIMLDDLIVGIYTNIVLLMLNRLFPMA